MMHPGLSQTPRGKYIKYVLEPTCYWLAFWSSPRGPERPTAVAAVAAAPLQDHLRVGG